MSYRRVRKIMREGGIRIRSRSESFHVSRKVHEARQEQMSKKNPVQGKKHTPETINKVRKASLGRTSWNKGLTKEDDSRLISKKRKGVMVVCQICGKRFYKPRRPPSRGSPKYIEKPGVYCSKECYDKCRSELAKKVWNNEDYCKNWAEGMRFAYQTKPNKPEKLFINIIEENDFSYKYVGDNSLRIGRLNPDFAHNNGEMKLIEIFGDYWHNRSDERYLGTVKGRIEYFKERGYDCLVLWEHELNNKQNIIYKVETFTGGI